MLKSEIHSVHHSKFAIRHSLHPALLSILLFENVFLSGGDGEKCECRGAKSEVQSVRHSEFVICPVAGDAVFLQHHGDGAGKVRMQKSEV